MVKLGYEAYDIVSVGDILLFAGIRFTICGAAISIFAFLKDKGSFGDVKAHIFPILLSGVFSIVLHYGFSYLGLDLTGSSKTAILKQTGVLFYVCFSFLFFKEDKFTLKKLVAVLVGFAGVIEINAGPSGVGFGLGDVLIIAASLCTVFSNVISKKVFQNIKPITATGIAQLFGGVVLLIIGVILGGGFQFAGNGSAGILFYICLASSVSYCIWFAMVKENTLSKLFIVKFAEPVFACGFSAMLLGENIFKVQYLVAFLLIAGGIYISNT